MSVARSAECNSGAFKICLWNAQASRSPDRQYDGVNGIMEAEQPGVLCLSEIDERARETLTNRYGAQVAFARDSIKTSLITNRKSRYFLGMLSGGAPIESQAHVFNLPTTPGLLNKWIDPTVESIEFQSAVFALCCGQRIRIANAHLPAEGGAGHRNARVQEILSTCRGTSEVPFVLAGDLNVYGDPNNRLAQLLIRLDQHALRCDRMVDEISLLAETASSCNLKIASNNGRLRDGRPTLTKVLGILPAGFYPDQILVPNTSTVTRKVGEDYGSDHRLVTVEISGICHVEPRVI